MQQATYKIRISAGLLDRGSVKQNIKSYCFENGIECTIDEEKSFWRSDFYVTLKGEHGLIVRAKKDLDAWIDDPFEK